jgi:hypothetical protein
LVERIVEATGVPDNLVESAAGTLYGLPDVKTDPQAREVIDEMRRRLKELGPPQNGRNGNAVNISSDRE